LCLLLFFALSNSKLRLGAEVDAALKLVGTGLAGARRVQWVASAFARVGIGALL
jgi:hypothetical protein